MPFVESRENLRYDWPIMDSSFHLASHEDDGVRKEKERLTAA